MECLWKLHELASFTKSHLPNTALFDYLERSFPTMASIMPFHGWPLQEGFHYACYLCHAERYELQTMSTHIRFQSVCKSDDLFKERKYHTKTKQTASNTVMDMSI